MEQSAFFIYGCPYTALEKASTTDAFLIPEPESSLYHFPTNINRILNLVGFSGRRDVRLIGCSERFSDQFHDLLAGHPEARFRVIAEGATCTQFSGDITGEPGARDVIVVERKPNLIPI